MNTFYIHFGLSLTLVQLLTSVTFAATPAEIQEALSARYKVSKRSGFSGQVKEAGTVLVVQKEGLRGDVPNMVLKPTVIHNREIAKVGGGSIIGGAGQNLKVGEKLYIHKIKVEKDYVAITFGTVQAYQTIERGNTISEPYTGAVAFQYPDGLASVTTEAILNDIRSWLLTEEEAKTVSTKTVQLGQSPDEVTGILGAPEKRIELGAKVVFVYKDMKVIFHDGKVADVQ